ncbi:histidine phosphatase family protein [Peribacillus alkalitolerans]|uniref:histidine phosphatase family protein n=1 Tax=Peribacillus alkalitolerans TaxID=1550385 RepID=UPI0013D8A057|nr:histidine phosphatase family protein [Peribacillus alkalitolerans]
MTTIGLIRHGITEWNTLGKAQGLSDIPLNEIGKQQALALANRLSLEDKWDMIVTSNLSRAIETAEIISSKLDVSITHIDERIREINYGDIVGTTEQERIEKWGSNWSELNLGMEKHEDVARRGIEFIREISLTYPEKRVLLVSHGSLIGLTLEHLLPERFQMTLINNTSVTILENIENKWECTLFNCTAHLEQKVN